MTDDSRSTEELTEALQELQSLNDEVTHDLHQRQRDLNQCQRDLADVRDQADALQAERDKLRSSVDGLRARADQLQVELDAVSAAAADTEHERMRSDALAAQLSVLHQQVIDLTSQRNTFRDRLQAQYDLTWTRIGGVLRQARTPRGMLAAPIRIVRVVRNRGSATAATGATKSVVSAAAKILGVDASNSIPPSPLALLRSANVPPVTEWDDPDAASEAATRLLEAGDAAITGAVVQAAVRRGDAEWIASLLSESTARWLSDDARLTLAEGLRDRGEIRRPLELLQAISADTGDVTDARAALTRSLDVIEHGIALTPPSMTRPSVSKVDSLYLLHNSLPYQSGGYATRTHGLLTGLQRTGRTVVGVTRPGFPPDKRVFDQRANIPRDDVIDGVRYSRLIGPVPALPRSNLQGFVNCYGEMLQPIVSEVGPRLIHGVSNWWNGHAAVAVAQALGVPSIYEVRGLWEVTRASRERHWETSDAYELDAIYESEAARHADRVIVITGGLRDEMVRRGVHPDKITIVPNAVDVQRFAGAAADDSVRRALGWDDRCILGFVGSVTFYEGLELLMSAVQMASSQTETRLGVLIVGDGPMLQPLVALADALGIADDCHFAGRVPHAEVEKYLNAIDVTPFPRLPLPVCEMVSPLKPLESMASSIPVIVSSVQALAEMVPEGCGLVVEKGSVTELADAITRLADDPALRAELAENAFEWVSQHRNWDVIVDRISQLYAELLG